MDDGRGGQGDDMETEGPDARGREYLGLVGLIFSLIHFFSPVEERSLSVFLGRDS